MLPYFCTVRNTLSIGSPACLATDSMMRRLAWCGTTRSICSAVTPHFAITFCDGQRHALDGFLEDLAAVEIPQRVAELRAAVGVDAAGAAHAQDLARVGVAAELLAEQSFLALSLACSTTAAQPSPKSTATLRLFQSMYGEITSTPITSALRTAPVRTIAVAADRRKGSWCRRC
jgi:hypothetical protein